MSKLSHVDNEGRARMVDVGEKPNQTRTAVASGFIVLQPDTVAQVRDNENKKGDVLTVAEIAGIQAAKGTSDLIPLCHPLQLTKVKVHAELMDDGVKLTSTVRCIGQTGVEMEALTATSVALLTIYDMCKAVDKQMVIRSIQLLNKTKV